MQGRTATLVKNKFSEYLFPTILTSAAVSIASLVDGIIVGNLLGANALAAVGLSSPFIMGNNAIVYMFSVGGVTLSSIARGERDERRANLVFTMCLMAGVAVMTLYAALVTAFAGPLCAKLAGSDAALAEQTRLYVSSFIWTGPFALFALCSAQFWRIEGSPKASMRISLIANGVNLVFDYALIRFFNAGIMGAGISTALGYAVGALFTAGYYRQPSRGFRFTRPGRDAFSCLLSVMGKGAYRSLTSAASLVQNLVLNTLIITSFGAMGMTVLTVCINALMVAAIFVGGASEAMQPVLSTLFGEKDIFGVRAVFKKAVTTTLLLCAPVVAVYIAYPGLMGSMFGISDPQGLMLLSSALRLYAPYIPLYAVSQLLQALYNSTDHSKRSVFMSVAEGVMLVNGFALLLYMTNSRIIWLCYALAGAAMLLIMSASAAWTRRKNPALNGLMLLPAQEAFTSWQTSIPCDYDRAEELSIGIAEFCAQRKLPEILANRMAVAAEEMAVNTARMNSGAKRARIDALICVSDEQVLLRLRDDGVLFNPLAYTQDDNMIHESIDLAMKMADKVTYSHQLGFNIAVLEFANPPDR